MTRSAKGTVEAPRRNVKAKSGLNRSLQDAALGRLAYWICVKAEEAGRRVWEVDPKNSSRECAPCGHIDAKSRKRTRFTCTGCDHQEHADVNASQVLTARGQAAEARWFALGSPPNRRPKPRLQRRKGDTPGTQQESEQQDQQYGAGPAPHAVAA
jgi:putative transposase